jgi:hypothetical protein
VATSALIIYFKLELLKFIQEMPGDTRIHFGSLEARERRDGTGASLTETLLTGDLKGGVALDDLHDHAMQEAEPADGHDEALRLLERKASYRLTSRFAVQ